jgi:hypothetical protein
MRSRSRVRYSACQVCAAAVTVAWGLCVGPMTAQPQTPASQLDAQATALKEFQKRLKAYVDLRADLAKDLEPLSPTANASDLAARQESLAAALRQARKTAKQGDLIPTGVAGQLRSIVQTDFKHRAPDARQAAFSEVAASGTPIINRVYPAKAALPTVPPLLLGKLPMLPDNLQYRFIDRHLVILDGDTQLIIDYVSNVLPLH